MAAITKSVHDFWAFLLAEGAVFILSGILAICLPPLFGLLFVVLLGWLLAVSGLTSLITTLLTRHLPGFAWSLLSSLLAMIVGISLFFAPREDMATVSLGLAAFLFLDGLFSVIVAVEHRRHFSPKWVWLLVAGAVDLLLAIVMLILLPGMDAWRLGLVVGVDMLVGGAALVIMSLDVRRAS